MRLSDLLRCRVIDADGVDLGQVKDVLVNSVLAVDGVVVGGFHATRLGFERGGAQGPWPIATLFRRLERKARFVPWEAVESCDHDTLRLVVSGGELGSPPPTS